MTMAAESPVTPPDRADLVIIGGGMVGVTLALLLAERLPQLHVVLLEATRFPVFTPGQPLPYTPSFDARNTALSRRTIQAFSDLGLWPQLQPHATPIRQIHVSDRGHVGHGERLAGRGAAGGAASARLGHCL
ncbi:MAG: hypothetical protein VW625_05230 [Perlucidibaca sp.]